MGPPKHNLHLRQPPSTSLEVHLLLLSQIQVGSFLRLHTYHYNYGFNPTGLFTSLTRRLGIHGLELVEMYDIEPWAVDHLNPYGLIFCFMWHKDSHRPADFEDPAAERVWFANQLSDDACATQAILNVLLNCPDIDIGEELRNFKEDTKSMSPVVDLLFFCHTL